MKKSLPTRPPVLLRQERGDANIIEYAIVLPVCLLVFFFLFMIGYMLNQYALLDSAAERGILIAQKAFADPNADKMLDFSGMTAASTAGFQVAEKPNYAKFVHDPYRFLNKNYKHDDIEKTIEETVSEIIRRNQLLGDRFLGETTVTYETGSGFLDKNVTVTVEQEFRPLRVIASVVPAAEGLVKLRSQAILKISSQTEFIRNTDFVCDLAVRFGLAQYVQKITGFFDKITDFFNGK